MLSLRLPTWVYWGLTALAALAALYFTVAFDLSDVPAELRQRTYFTIWGGPATLAIASLVVTLLKRRSQQAQARAEAQLRGDAEEEG